MVYFCGYSQAGATAGLVGVRAVNTTRSVTLPEGGQPFSAAALIVNGGGDSPLSLGFGYAQRAGALAGSFLWLRLRSAFGGAFSHSEQWLRPPGAGNHLYEAVLTPGSGTWVLRFDGSEIAYQQNSAWTGVAGLTVGFGGLVPYLEVPLLGTAAAPCRFQGLEIRARGDWQPLPLSALTQASLQAGTLTPVAGIDNGFDLAAKAS
ncbi:hypothetical protein SAMN06265365_13248 [Tistlia consotensis]|uniref:Uncharacterized protein n=1 Tax=Tistlia consotensis USBA 355 TaxID=560819 RepID=A0A1Y6CLW6_9PROT|nr:hypothetical protein [Tistlia consotensis]SMF76408.1 hypothetical protein SAMN05428998_13548 [Tistlia consotensis USBA 355]SNS12884.1 hypothetical protein SAMN06265365_13248 [Tistlia consotensis]